MQLQNNTLNFAGQNIYVGLDTHLKSWKVTIMHEKIVHKTFVQVPEPEKLVEYLKRNFPGATYHSAYEASFCGFWIHNKLVDLGVKNIVVNPADIPTTDKERKQKEDKRDSRKIARGLENGELQGIYIPGEDNLEDRAMLRLREKLSGDLTRYKCKIKSFLYFHGIKFPEEFENSSHWSKKFIRWIEELDFKRESGIQVRNSLLNGAKAFREELLILTRQIKKLSQTKKFKNNFEFITSVPGIGLITGMSFLTEIDKIERFLNIDYLSSYVGLIPSTASSGDKDIVRGITPRKNRRLRKMLIESSWIAIRRDPALSLAYANYVKKMEPNKAIIKIARKLLNRISYVLRTQKKYETCVVK
jgi:transposase